MSEHCPKCASRLFPDEGWTSTDCTGLQCKGCAAKDAEIARLTHMVAEVTAERDQLKADLEAAENAAANAH